MGTILSGAAREWEKTCYLKDLATLCSEMSIELRDRDRVYCCGEPMEIGFDGSGMDFARCLCCGNAIANMASPRLNGGMVPGGKFIKVHGGRTWLAMNQRVEAT